MIIKVRTRMNSYFYNLAKTGLTMMLVDAFYLFTVGIFIRKMFEEIQGRPIAFRVYSAILVYVFLAYMLLETTSYKQAFFYGISIYAVYEFTNLAIFDKYDWKLAAVDTLWGGILFVSSRYLLKNVF